MKTGFRSVMEHNRDISGLMDQAEVARKIINALMIKGTFNHYTKFKSRKDLLSG